ncbi:MAG: M20/M25/M40 family metallo-hydrolase [Chloroflexi bacterium]|nr:M20/M25/M40 family metallo-hydrolase [Chloroflexota bacterium]
MKKNPSHLYKTLAPVLVLVMLIGSTLACSLTEEDPPTLAPRQPMSTTTSQPPLVPVGPVTIQAPPVLPELPPEVQEEVPTNNSVTNWLLYVDNNRMMNTVLAMENFQNRHNLGVPAPDKGIFAAELYLKARFDEIKDGNPDKQIAVYTQPLSISYGGLSSNPDNIFMVLPGLDASAGVLVVGAHYDTINNASVTSSDLLQPGADDNGSGVSIVLELARVMAQGYHRATIIFVLFAGEEFEQRFGSTNFVGYLKGNNLDIKGVLTLDMVGSPTGPNGERYDNQMRVFSAPPADSGSRELARLMELVSRAYMQGEMNVTVEELLDRSGRWGDHMSFSNEGISAIRMIEYRDDPTRTHNAMDRSDDVDPAYLGRMTKLALATLLVLADGPNPPQDYRIDTGTWHLEWTPVPGATAYAVALRFPGSSVYNQIFTTPESGFTWPQMSLYETVGVAAIDENGQLGRFVEWRIPPVPTQ